MTRSGKSRRRLRVILTGAEMEVAFRLSNALAVISNVPAESHLKSNEKGGVKLSPTFSPLTKYSTLVTEPSGSDAAAVRASAF